MGLKKREQENNMWMHCRKFYDSLNDDICLVKMCSVEERFKDELIKDEKEQVAMHLP
jgi:hypothetical protein